jgi:methionine sulfoxide reductase heme-binding subunit
MATHGAAPAREPPRPARRAPRRAAALRAGVWAGCATPAAALLVRGLAGDLGANPIERITLETGWWALALLLLTLAVTPVRRLTGWSHLAPLRRTLGLWAFGYATVHLLVFLALDHAFDPAEILDDARTRPFIAAGFAAFLLLAPLAATSSRAWIRRLGRNWTRLHRLVYAAAALAVLHFYWKRAAKLDVAEPLLFAAVLAVLLGTRVGLAWVGRRRGARVRR